MESRSCTILGIEKPVVQGPMVYLTDAKLVAVEHADAQQAPKPATVRG
jgi:NAD(P)H-dependent flavin oxidoreductase YrpB (nitropropane dioxygenase family)